MAELQQDTIARIASIVPAFDIPPEVVAKAKQRLIDRLDKDCIEKLLARTAEPHMPTRWMQDYERPWWSIDYLK